MRTAWMRFCLAGTATGFAVSVFAAELKEVGRRCIREESCPMNFCFAQNFPDGTIYLGHTMGRHQVDERGTSMLSTDNGKTWRKDAGRDGFNCYLTKDGKKRWISCWDLGDRAAHDIDVLTEEPDGSRTKAKSRIVLPRGRQLRIHREVLRLADDRLLVPAYSWLPELKKCSAFVLESKDEGLTWGYLSELPYAEGSQEGMNEATLVQRKDGTILAFVRTGDKYAKDESGKSVTALMRYVSTDGGRTWGGERAVADYGVAPQAKILSDGTLTLLSGRPGVYLLVDPTGTGDHFRRYDVFSGMGSSYSTLMETAPGRLLLVYDQSSFTDKPGDTPQSRIMLVDYIYR